jgi:hypothetical protein
LSSRRKKVDADLEGADQRVIPLKPEKPGYFAGFGEHVFTGCRYKYLLDSRMPKTHAALR